MKRRYSTVMAISAIVLFGFSSRAQAAEMLTSHSEMIPAAVPVPHVAITTGIAVTSVTIGYTSPGIPCYNAYCGGNPSAISIPFPVYEIGSGSSYTITIQMQDFGYTGTPIVSTNVFQGGKIIAYGAVLFPGELSPGYVAYETFSGTIPNTSGPGTILVEVSDSVTGASLAKNSTPFYVP